MTTSTATKTAPPTETAAAVLAFVRKQSADAILNGWPDTCALLVVWPALEVLHKATDAERADIGRLSHALWDVVRGLPVTPDGPTLDIALSRLPLSAAPPLALRTLLAALAKGGDFLRRVEQERDALNRVILEYGPLRRG